MKHYVVAIFLISIYLTLSSLSSITASPEKTNALNQQNIDTLEEGWVDDSLSESEIIIDYLKNCEHNYFPEKGCVPDSATAIKIALAILTPIYGKETIDFEQPFHAVLNDSVWVVYGSLPEGWVGGVAIIEILKQDCRVMRITHDK